MYCVVALLLCAYCLDAQSPQEILKNAVAAQQSGRLDSYLRLGRNKDVIDLLTALAAGRSQQCGVQLHAGTALVRNGDIGRGQIIIHQASPGSATITQTNSTFGIAQYKQGQRIVELQAKFFF
jgi:hypothetical protein